MWYRCHQSTAGSWEEEASKSTLGDCDQKDGDNLEVEDPWWCLELERRGIRQSWNCISCPGKWLSVSLLYLCPWFSIPQILIIAGMAQNLLCWLSVHCSLQVFVHIYGTASPCSKGVLLWVYMGSWKGCIRIHRHVHVSDNGHLQESFFRICILFVCFWDSVSLAWNLPDCLGWPVGQ